MPMVVLLPAPLWPNNPKTSPRSTRNDKSFTATFPPNFLVTFRSSIMGLWGPADYQEVFDVAVRVEIIHRMFRPERAVKFLLVKHERNERRLRDAEHLQIIGVLPVQQAVPGIARFGLLENALVVRWTAQDSW